MTSCGYMGSAAVIGEMMLPVLQPLSPAAKEPARALGFAFQLTTLPCATSARTSTAAGSISRRRTCTGSGPRRRRGVDDAWRALMAFEIERNRRLYDAAREGVPLLPPRSARCVATALRLYPGSSAGSRRRDYDVFSGRARVPTWRKAVTAATVLVAGPRVAEVV